MGKNIFPCHLFSFLSISSSLLLLLQKQYVDFDDACVEPRINDVLRSLHPGQVDNSSLHVGAYGDELLRGLEENKDYVLLPDDVFKMLIKEYTGGPHFGRKVLNKGKIWAPNYFVDLYPIRFEVCLCTKPVPGMYYLVKVFHNPYVAHYKI